MSLRKIIFLIIATLVIGGSIFGIWFASKNAKNAKLDTKTSVSIWVVGGTSEQYNSLFADLGKYDPTYAKLPINIRVFPDYAQYQRILMGTLADGNGPDIFMVDAGGDDILASKVEPLPGDVVDLSNFEKRYDDIFLPLFSSTGAKDTLKTSLQGVPLGYETLGIFYNKSLLRSIPKTWNDLTLLSTDGTAPGVFPSNLGLSSRYTPYALDIISLFLSTRGTTSYDTKGAGSVGLADYLAYGQTPLTPETPSDSIDTTITSSTGKTLEGEKPGMNSEKLTTIDLFMRGKIAFVVGYPRLIEEIEKAQKRAGTEAVDALILAEHIPRSSLGEGGTNIARYSYLGLSKNTKNPVAAAKVLSYLMTDSALTKAQEVFPKYISPIRTLAENQTDTSLSSVFARVKMNAFLPLPDEKLQVFHFGLRTEYDSILTDAIDRNEKIDMNNIIETIHNSLQCEIESVIGGDLSTKCEQSN